MTKDLTSKLNELPVARDFSKLKCGVAVYSKKHGLGEVERVYKTEVIIRFSFGTLRIAPEESDFSIIPAEMKGKKKRKPMVGGWSERPDEKGSYLTPEWACVPIVKVADILAVTRAQAILLCKEHSIELLEFRKKKMITKSDLQKLWESNFTGAKLGEI